MGPKVIRADGLRVSDLLAAIIPLFELDSYAPPLIMMAAVEGDTLDASVEQRYLQALSSPDRRDLSVTRIDRFAFTNEPKRPLRSSSQARRLNTGIYC